MRESGLAESGLVEAEMMESGRVETEMGEAGLLCCRAVCENQM